MVGEPDVPEGSREGIMMAWEKSDADLRPD